MAAANKPKAVEVVLSDESVVLVREPKPSEYLRIMGVEIAVAKMHSGDELTDGDDANVRHALVLLGTHKEDDEPVSDEWLLSLGQGDWARLFIGIMQIIVVGNQSPKARLTSSAKSSSSPATPPA